MNIITVKFRVHIKRSKERRTALLYIRNVDNCVSAWIYNYQRRILYAAVQFRQFLFFIEWDTSFPLDAFVSTDSGIARGF